MKRLALSAIFVLLCSCFGTFAWAGGYHDINKILEAESTNIQAQAVNGKAIRQNGAKIDEAKDSILKRIDERFDKVFPQSQDKKILPISVSSPVSLPLKTEKYSFWGVAAMIVFLLFGLLFMIIRYLFGKNPNKKEKSKATDTPTGSTAAPAVLAKDAKVSPAPGPAKKEDLKVKLPQEVKAKIESPKKKRLHKEKVPAKKLEDKGECSYCHEYDKNYPTINFGNFQRHIERAKTHHAEIKKVLEKKHGKKLPDPVWKALKAS